ncbi:hypothetical protein ISS07_02620 [Candidatus Woesearchaeota archaeon]|nr:hypothetical protein [Candidatus Woesearchaeota archaeon]
MFNTPEQNVIESSKEEEDDSAESVIKQEDSKQVDLDLQDLEEYHD